MSNRTGNIILLGMVAGAIIGALGGYYFGGFFIEIKFLGTLFLNALKMIVVPLIVASMIVGVTSLGDIRKLGRTTGKTLVYYLATTGFAVLIGIILVNIIQPGTGISGIGNNVPDFVAKTEPATYSDFIVSLIPDNLIDAAAKGSVLPLIIFSLVFGGVLTAIGRKGRPVISFFEGLNDAIMKIVVIIIYFAPIGILSIIGGIVAENRGSLVEIVSGLGLYSLTVIIGLLIHGMIVLPLILKAFGKKNPFQYFLNMGQSLATAFTTASSSASLPITMECVTEKNKVSSKSASFVLPLGATINMDGTALYEAVAAIFIAQAINFPLSIDAQIIIFLTATLASIGAAAIPHAGLVTMVIVLSAVGLPLEGIGFIFAVDWFLDRCRTTVNVWGDSVGAAVIGETAEMKTYQPPAVPASRSPQTDRKPQRKNKTRQDRPERQSQPATPDRQQQQRGGRSRYDRDRGGQGGRRDGRSRPSQGRPYRDEGQDQRKKSPAPSAENSRDAGRERGPRDDFQSRKVKTEPAAPEKPKADVSPELDTIRKQLDTISGLGIGGPEIERETDSRKSSDDFFDTKFSKMDLFGEGRRTDQGGAETGSDSERIEPAKSPETGEKSAGETADEKVVVSGRDDEKADEPQDDYWGREKKKRPYK
nr:dicarboxylate/amino acid:cation symporter [candidate division Zixibacteria bacterium]